MRKLIKHLKPFTGLILVIFLLLFGQAMADLSLPGYMADIVNIGIQQNGIESPVPRVIRAGEYEKLKLFMSIEDRGVADSCYILLEKSGLSPDRYEEYVGKYPGLAETPVYELGSAGESGMNRLEEIFLKAIPVVYGIEQRRFDVPGGEGMQIPEGADPFAVIASLPGEQLASLRDAAGAQLAAMPENTLIQFSTAYIADEYEKLGMNIGGIQTGYMLRSGLLMLLLTLASAAASVAVGYLSARIAAALGRNMRKQLFEKVESFSNAEFDRFSTASLITRSTNDITQVQMLMVMLFRIVFYAPILGVGGVIKVIGADSSMLWIIGAAVGVVLTLMLVMIAIAIPKFQSVQNLVDKLNLVTREILTGLMVIRAFNTHEHEEKRFDRANADLTKTNLFINRVMVFMMPAMMLIMNGVMLLIVWVGAHQIDAGAMQVGDMMAFMQYAMQIIMAFLMVAVVFVMLPRAVVSAERVSEVLETEPVVNDPAAPKKFGMDMKGMVELRDVSFRYPGAEDDVLSHISFTAKPGQTTAIIGSTGSGKSTLVNLIPRFYDVTEGKVLVDGIDVRNVTQHDLRERIGYISQKAMLFSGTAESNIRYAREDAAMEEVQKYAKVAQAADFFKVKGDGNALEVAQGGANLSGGQKQRLAIARALIKQPEIYIFDDALSALDYRTERALRTALKKETAGATVLIVTQRVSTVMNADQILVLDDGKIAGIGRHRDLLESCAVYREIALSQLSGEELHR